MFAQVTTLNQAAKIIEKLIADNKLKIWLKIHGQQIEFFYGDHDLLIIKTDRLNSGSNEVQHIVRTPSEDGKRYDILREIRTKQRIKNTGFQKFWDICHNFALKG